MGPDHRRPLDDAERATSAAPRHALGGLRLGAQGGGVTATRRVDAGLSQPATGCRGAAGQAPTTGAAAWLFMALTTLVPGCPSDLPAQAWELDVAAATDAPVAEVTAQDAHRPGPRDAAGSDAAGSDTAQDVEALAEIGPTILCNGSAALCDRPLDRVVFPTTHNAMSSEADGWFAPNQPFGLERQLEDGVRGMLLDTHMNGGELYLCHSLCILGALPLSEGLAILRAFLEANPHEVLVLILQDGTPTLETADAFDEAGLTSWIYTHPAPTEPFPTLGALITAGERLVVTAESGSPPPAWYHHVWDLTWDTEYSFNALDQFDCTCNRGCPADKPLFLMNHWLSTPLGLPDATQAQTVNGYAFLFERAARCWQQSGRIPNFVAVDHYATGDLFSVVHALNEAVGAGGPPP